MQVLPAGIVLVMNLLCPPARGQRGPVLLSPQLFEAVAEGKSRRPLESAVCATCSLLEPVAYPNDGQGFRAAMSARITSK
jgi:hypothetical protein